ncbi:MAG TPA: polyketide synthase, partial [Cellulomonas sp.]
MTVEDEKVPGVAVVGMAGRFPGAGSVDELWENLVAGTEQISRFTPDELLAAGVPAEVLAQDRYVPARGVLADGDLFDAELFGYSPREAELMDPQHRVFLECAWRALESAGLDPATFPGRIGVFAGTGFNTYLVRNLLHAAQTVGTVGEFQTLLGNDKDFLATRTSYKLDLRGPSLTVQTACSTSLSAVHLACQSLLDGECDVALAGGVTVSVPATEGYLYATGGISSPDGHCRPFDRAAAGTVGGSGVGLVVLRRADDALADGVEVHA